MRRRYNLGRRGEAAEETRRRIVEACYAVHGEQGVSATSMKDVAERAGVSVGTVYHHFPTADDLITACGQFASAVAPLPTEAVFAGAATRKERVRRLAAAMFGYFGPMPFYERIRCDRDKVRQVREFIEAEEARRLALTRAALAPADERLVKVAAAVLDPAVCHSLCAAGFSPHDAAQEVAALINARLDRRAAALAPQNRPKRTARS